MHAIIRPIFKPLPLLGLTTSGLFLAAATLKQPLSTMSTNTPSWPVKAYTPRHASWPYTAADFTRQDPSPDPSFYRSPRFVTHIDDAAIATLRDYYATVLPVSGQARILDFCSSWVSHYPAAVQTAAAQGEVLITGLGMNEAELDANEVLNNGRLLVDLNVQPDIHAALREAKIMGGGESESEKLLDVATNVVSTDYLTQPVEVLASLLAAMKPGAAVHLVISNRCFPTKAISRWLRVGEEERLQMVGDFLHFAGWRGIEIVTLSDGSAGGGGGASSLQGIMAMVGMNVRDHLWVVRAVKE